MTSEEINQLPTRVRDYIHQLETICDPAGMVREITQLKDVQRELEASNRMLRYQVEALTKVALGKPMKRSTVVRIASFMVAFSLVMAVIAVLRALFE